MLKERQHTRAELSNSNTAIVLLVKDLESVDELVVGSCRLEAIGAHQDFQKRFKVDHTCAYPAEIRGSMSAGRIWDYKAATCKSIS